ncbi:MAG TPA: cyclic nucleotide-binding domain-containing protein [Candidatus Limnocylindria bacterium]|nr:cyclic nucleotide-binding domain-containing protein [Candidatus Limnocylindria bacterium]
MRTGDQERSERLRTVDLLSQLDRVALARLAGYMVPLAFAAGEVICSEGDPADGLYIVVRGTLGVYATGAGGERRMNAIGPGHYVGELALLVDQPRSATIRADTEGEILRLDRDQFLQLLGQDPAAAKAVATTLARRLRRRDMDSPTEELEAAAAPRQVVAGRIARRPAAKVVGLVLALAFGIIAFSPLIDLLPFLRNALAQQRFVLLLLAAVALWVTEPVPNVVVSLGLVATWIIGKLTYGEYPPFAGFASLNWVFVISVLGIAAMVSRSGLLLRMGLLLIERVPPRLGWQSAAFLVSGIVLTPILPLAMARAAVSAPLALSVAEALKLRDRSPASAVLGLSAWIGSGPFIFLFLNGSPVCLLAWAIMPTAAQNQFTWTQWFLAAAPLAAIIGVGSFIALRLLHRGEPIAPVSRDPLRLQRAVLGRPSRRELALMGIVLLTLVGWILAPHFQIHPGLIALIAFIAAMTLYGRSNLASLDWDYLVFYGVALTIANFVVGLSLDRILKEGAAPILAQLEIGGPAFVLLAGVLTIVVRSLLAADQAIILLSIALIPVASVVGISPWLAVIPILALGLSWHIPAQSPEYLVAYGASQGRLFSHAQGRRMAFVYDAIALGGLALCLPYWHLLGLL